MKIFSNFDSNYKKKICASYVEEHGSDNVLVVNRSKLFGRVYVYLPLLWYTILAVGIVYIIAMWLDIPVINWFVLTMVVIWWIALLLPVIKKYIDYKLDFAIVTPKWVSLYNQTWIFNRNVTSLNVNNIRSIVVKKKWLIFSMFNNGSITILSEWTAILPEWSEATTSIGEAKMHYVHDPEIKRAKIREIFSKTHLTNY